MVNVPTVLVAGDSFAWERDLDDYPAGTWTLTYYFSSPDSSFDIEATASGTTHVVSVADTSAYRAGRYRWHARVTDGATTVTIEDGWLEVRPDPAKGTHDWRSHARKMLDAVEAALEGQATKNQMDLISYSVGGSIDVRRDRSLLLQLRQKYQQELAGEEGAVNNSRMIPIRFTRP